MSPPAEGNAGILHQIPTPWDQLLEQLAKPCNQCQCHNRHGRGTSCDPEDQDIVRGHYTCYRQPCTNWADPFPSHWVPQCKEPTSVNIGLRFLWHSVTHRGIQLLAQAHRWNNGSTEDDEPCDVCGKKLEEHDL